MATYVVIKRPGQPAEVIEAPEKLELEYLQARIGGFIEIYPSRGLVSDILQGVTLIIDEDGGRKELPPNIQLPLATVVGPVLACLTDDEGDDHGMPLEQAEAVARALDFYAVGMPELVN